MREEEIYYGNVPKGFDRKKDTGNDRVVHDGVVKRVGIMPIQDSNLPRDKSWYKFQGFSGDTSDGVLTFQV